MVKKLGLVAPGVLLLASCVTPAYRASDALERVVPTRMYWISPDGTDDGSNNAKQACNRELRQNSDYMSALSVVGEIARTARRDQTLADVRRQREANLKASDHSKSCMLERGFQYVRKGVEISH